MRRERVLCMLGTLNCLGSAMITDPFNNRIHDPPNRVRIISHIYQI